MKFSLLRQTKTHVSIFLIASTILMTIVPSHAYFYTGGDWHGMDLSLSNGDSLSGSFSNVGQFYIPSGASISGSTDDLVVHANRFLIDGSLTGIAVPGYKVELNSLTDLILNGSITSWQSISLSAQQVFLNSGSSITIIGGSASLVGGSSGSDPSQNGASGSISLTGKSGIGDDFRPPPSGVILSAPLIQLPLTGGTISLVPTPVPAAVWLLGSGLLGLAGIRRRRG